MRGSGLMLFALDTSREAGESIAPSLSSPRSTPTHCRRRAALVPRDRGRVLGSRVGRHRAIRSFQARCSGDLSPGTPAPARCRAIAASASGWDHEDQTTGTLEGSAG
jgi:hypothetical protein